MALRGPKVWLWRWRRNPLKRRADRVEAWVVLGVWTLTAFVGMLAGTTVSRSVEDGMARERVEWRPLVARLEERAPGRSAESGGVSRTEQVWAKATWTAVDGSVHTGQLRVPAGSAAGTPVTVWTDPEGRQVTRPVTASQAHVRAFLAGGVAGIGAALLPLVGGRALRSRLERGRMDQWDAEWSRFGPMWGRTTG
ncbi:Rv1733c family protein [Streptomyces sp. CA-179760]|uniref:Rv1733c family protein n=1 Tax=Streptomyces sp. CA-179760 TaxID=3240054 RepID=UPI003D92C5F8